MPHSLTTLKDRATQLLIKYKSGALVTQWADGNNDYEDDDSIDGDDDDNDGGQELMKPQRADSSSWQNVWFRHTALRFLKI